MNKDFKEAKKEYEKMKAPESLKNSVMKNFETPKKKNGIGIFAASIAAVFTLFTISLNTNEVFARNLSNIDALKGVVKILTGGKYEVEDNYISADITTPKITGLSDKEFENFLNEELAENANVVMEALKEEMEKRVESGLDYHLGVDYGYEIKADTDQYIVLDVYVVNTVASSQTIHTFYNIDKVNNKLITLKEWVNNENYVAIINDYIKKEMLEREEEQGYAYFWKDEFAFETINEDTKFYINQKGNAVISFEKYEIAPGAYGNVEFEIPNELF